MGNTKEPLVSVIVPVYNVEQYLEQCIKSIVNQTYHNLEIILVNDGSTDGSGTICEQYRKKDHRIQVIHQENRGLSGARNAGMDVFSGEYIMFIDSDDFVDHEIVEVMLREALENKLDIVLCGTVLCDQSGNKMSSSAIARSEIYTEDLFHPFFRSDYYSVSAWGKLYHRDMVKGIYFPDRKYHEDMFVAHRFLSRAKRVMIMDKAYYWYRQVQGSITHRSFQIKHLDAIEACVERSNFIKEIESKWSDESNAALVYTCCKCLERMFQASYYDREREQKIQRLVRQHVKQLVQNDRYSLYTKVFAVVYCFSPKVMRWIYTTIKQ